MADLVMIKDFRNKNLENFFLKNQTKGIRAEHIKKLRQILAVLHAATTLDDIQSVRPLRCHALTGRRNGYHAVLVNKSWRVTFKCDHGEISAVDYEDYHDCKVRR